MKPPARDARDPRHARDAASGRRHRAPLSQTPFELLVATILSAQSTDARVNLVDAGALRALSRRAALASATHGGRSSRRFTPPASFARSRSRSLGMAQALVANARRRGAGDDGGAGRAAGRRAQDRERRARARARRPRTAGRSACPARRESHRHRRSRTIRSSVEQQLCEAMPPERWTRTSDTLILHGRRICRPKPLCDQCFVVDDCDYYRTAVIREREGRTHGSALRRRTGTGSASRQSHRGTARGEKVPHL